MKKRVQFRVQQVRRAEPPKVREGAMDRVSDERLQEIRNLLDEPEDDGIHTDPTGAAYAESAWESQHRDSLLASAVPELLDEIDRLRAADAEREKRDAAARMLYDVAKTYEQWEADVILNNKCWPLDAGNPHLTGDEWGDRIIEIQAQRNAALQAWQELEAGE